MGEALITRRGGAGGNSDLLRMVQSGDYVLTGAYSTTSTYNGWENIPKPYDGCKKSIIFIKIKDKDDARYLVDWENRNVELIDGVLNSFSFKADGSAVTIKRENSQFSSARVKCYAHLYSAQ